MIRARHLPLAILALLVAGPALAQAPEVVPYQGYLTDANGDVVNGNLSMTFRLYDQSDANAPIWEESWPNVQVQDGVFVVYLGQSTPLVDNVLEEQTRYLGIEVGNDGEAQPRQRIGAVPYSIYARDAYYFRGYSPDYFVTDQELADLNLVTENDVRVLIAEEGGGGEIDLDGYVSDEELAAALAGLDDTYVTHAELDAALEGLGDTYVTIDVLDARNYVDGDDLAAYVTRVELEDTLANYVTFDDLAAAIADFITEADLALYLEDNNFVTVNDLEQYLENNEFVVQADVDALNARIDALEARIDALAAAGVDYVLGRSAQTSTGRFTFNNVSGIQAANAMCAASFPNDPTAHFCSADEVMRAIAMGSYNAANAATFDNVETWTMAQTSFSEARGTNSLANTCQGLMYQSADVANGTRLTVQLNFQSPGNGGGVTGAVVKLEQEIGCGNSYPVLCCR